MMIVFTSCANMEEARKLAQLIIDQRLAACVQFHEVGSMYTWKGELKAVKETLMVIKTLESKLQHIEDVISANHSYSVPEIAAVDVRRINRPYKEWMQEVMG